MLLDAACTEPSPALPDRSANTATAPQPRDDARPCGNRGNEIAPQTTNACGNTHSAPSDPGAAVKSNAKDGNGIISDECKSANGDDSKNEQNAADGSVAQIALTLPVVGAITAPVSADTAPVQPGNQASDCVPAPAAPTVSASADPILDTEALQAESANQQTPDTQSIDTTTKSPDDSSPAATTAESATTKTSPGPAIPINSAKAAGAIDATAPADHSDDAAPATPNAFADSSTKTEPSRTSPQTDQIERATPAEQSERVITAPMNNAPALKKTEAQTGQAKTPIASEKSQTDTETANANSTDTNPVPTNAAPHPQNAKTGTAKTETEPEQDQPRQTTSEHFLAPETTTGPANRPVSAPITMMAGTDTLPISGAQIVTNQAAPVLAAPAAFLIAVPNAIPLSGLPIEIATQAKDGKNRFEIRLDPPELGRIDVRLDIDKQGNVTSRLMVERQETLDLLRRDSSQLERALQNAGLKTSDQGLQFSLRDQSFSGRSDSAPSATVYVLPEDDSPPIAMLRQGYGQRTGLGAGIDIRV